LKTKDFFIVFSNRFVIYNDNHLLFPFEELTAGSMAYYYKSGYVSNNWEYAFGQETYFIYFLVYHKYLTSYQKCGFYNSELILLI
jgi:hypothetical protein